MLSLFPILVCLYRHLCPAMVFLQPLMFLLPDVAINWYCHIYDSPLLHFVQLAGRILTCTIMPPACMPICYHPYPIVTLTVFSDICCFIHLVPIRTTCGFVVLWCFQLFFPSKCFCLRHSLSNLSPVATIQTYSQALVLFGQWLWSSPWPPCFSLSKELSVYLSETSAPVLLNQ